MWRNRANDSEGLQAAQAQMLERKKQQRQRKLDGSRKRVNARKRVVYAQNTAEAKAQAKAEAVQKRQQTIARRKAEKARARYLAENQPLFKALGLTTEQEIDFYLRFAEMISAKVVLVLSQRGIIHPTQVEPSLMILQGNQ